MAPFFAVLFFSSYHKCQQKSPAVFCRTFIFSDNSFILRKS